MALVSPRVKPVLRWAARVMNLPVERRAADGR